VGTLGVRGFERGSTTRWGTLAMIFSRESSEKRANRVVRTTRKERKQEGEHHPRPYHRESYRVNLTRAMAEWAEDYQEVNE
jgi:hypothetical protein